MRSRLIILMAVLGASMVAAEEPKKAVADVAGKIGVGETVITSKKLDFDYKHYIASFEGDVVAKDPAIKIQADKITVSFETNNSIKRAVCDGSVKVDYQDKTATGDKVIYTAGDAKVLILGNAKLMRGANVVSGDKITVWLNDEKMEVFPGHLVIVPEKDGSGADSIKDMLPGKGDKKEKK